MVIKDIYSLFDKSDCLMILEKLYKYSFSDSIIHSNDEINGKKWDDGGRGGMEKVKKSCK